MRRVFDSISLFVSDENKMKSNSFDLRGDADFGCAVVIFICDHDSRLSNESHEWTNTTVEFKFNWTHSTFSHFSKSSLHKCGADVRCLCQAPCLCHCHLAFHPTAEKWNVKWTINKWPKTKNEKWKMMEQFIPTQWRNGACSGVCPFTCRRDWQSLTQGQSNRRPTARKWCSIRTWLSPAPLADPHSLSLNRMSSKHNVYSLFQFNFFKHLSSLSNRISILVFFIKRGKTNKKFFSQFFQNICASIVWLISEHFRRQRQKGIAILSYRIINGGRQYS